MTKIPFFGVDRQYARYRKEFLEIADRIWSSGKVLQGEDVADLEEKTRAICGRKFGVAVGSCTDALAFAMIAAGIKPGDEVLVTSFSFFASASQILRVGARPCFVDIDPRYYLMDLARAEQLVTPKTKALIAVHLFGQTLPMKEVQAFTDRHGLILIEDAAQAIGSFDGARPAGSLGAVSCISFDPTKVVNSFSSAGILVTDNPEIAETTRMLRYHGKSPTTKGFEILGYNSQLANDMAGMLAFKLGHIQEWQRQREVIANIYREGLAELPAIALPEIREGSTHNWHKFVIRTSQRNGLQEHLRARGIETMVHYSKPMCDEGCMKALKLSPAATNVPVARQAAVEVLSLPSHQELTATEAEYVVESVREFAEVRERKVANV